MTANSTPEFRALLAVVFSEDTTGTAVTEMARDVAGIRPGQGSMILLPPRNMLENALNEEAKQVVNNLYDGEVIGIFPVDGEVLEALLTASGMEGPR